MKGEEGRLIHVPMEVLVYINRLPSDFKKRVKGLRMLLQSALLFHHFTISN